MNYSFIENKLLYFAKDKHERFLCYFCPWQLYILIIYLFADNGTI